MCNFIKKNDMYFYMDVGEKARDLAGVFLHRVGMNIHKLNCILNFLNHKTTYIAF